jgi:hypothetical protein
MVNNSIENWTEDIESKNKPKKSPADLKQEFIKEFIFEWTRNKDEKTEFINSIFSEKGKKDPDLNEKLIRLQKNNKYKEINLDDIKDIDLKEKLLNERQILVNKRDNFKNHIIANYVITNNDYNTKIQDSIELLNEKELSELMNSERNTNDLLKDKLGEEPVTKNFKSFLDKFNAKNSYTALKNEYTDLKNKYDTLSDEEKKNLIEVETKFRSLESFYDIDEIEWNYILKEQIDEEDIYSLFESWVLEENTNEILSKYLVTMDLERLLELGLINEDRVQKEKERFIEKEISRILDNEHKQKLLEEIDIKLIKLNIADLNKEEYIYENIRQFSLKSIVKSYNDIMIEVSKKQNKLNDFVWKLNQLWEINLKEGNILTIQKIDSEWVNIGTNFFRIDDLWLEDWKVKVTNKTSVDDKYTEKWANKKGCFSHKEIIDILESKKPSKKQKTSNPDNEIDDMEFSFSLKCYSVNEFESKLYDVEDHEFTECEDELELVSIDDINKKYIRKKLIEDEKISKNISDDELEKNKDYKDFVIVGDDEEYQSLLNINIDKLTQKIDILDNDWIEYGLKEGVTFETKEGTFFTIKKIDTSDIWKITIVPVNWWPEEPITFEDFLKWWKLNEAKRKSNVNDVNKLFTDVVWYSDIWAEWWKFEYKNGWIYKKSWNENQKYEYDYIVAKPESGSNELLKIHSIDWDTAVISFWEIKVEKDKKDKKNKKTTFWVESDEYSVNIWYIDSWIKKNSWIPRSLDEEIDVKEENNVDVGIKWHFWSRFFDRLSVMDLFRWWKLYVESIENYIKEGQEENAAKLANALWLPEELKADLIAREESAKKKRMDGYVEKLKWIDSWPATEMIAKWLLNKNSSDPKKEAWVIFMMEKYWVLYAKSWLYKHKWTFLWYQALWWKIGDPLYREIKEQMENSDQVFTEEHLVYVLLVKQCTKWLNWIKRRSRLHKEFKAFRAKWKEGEFDTWKQDGWDISKCDDIVKFALGEITGWTYPNWAWWLEVVVERGWSVATMNKIPFVLLFSWAAYSMEEKTRDLIRKMPEKWMILPLVSLIRYKSGIDIATNVILELSKRIEQLEWKKYEWMWDAAQKVFDNMHKVPPKLTEEEKVKNTIEFYDKYWEALMDSLYSLNKPSKYKDDKDAYINNIIYIEKDDYEDENWDNKEWNKVFKKYHDTLQGNAEQYEYKEDFMNDAHKKSWMTWFDSYKTLTYALKVNSWGSYINSGSAPTLVNEMDVEMTNIINDKSLTDEVRKKLIIKSLRWLIWSIVAVSSASLQRSKQLLPFFGKYWITLNKLEWLDKEEILDLKKGSREYKFINELSDDIINKFWNNVESINTRDRIDDIISELPMAA